MIATGLAGKKYNFAVFDYGLVLATEGEPAQTAGQILSPGTGVGLLGNGKEQWGKR